MTNVPADDGSERMQYRRSGRSGPKLPPISPALWQNFGGAAPLERSRAILRRAFISPGYATDDLSTAWVVGVPILGSRSRVERKSDAFTGLPFE